MLAELQDHLTKIYRVDPGYDVRDFLITDPVVAGTLGQGALLSNSAESVLLVEEDDGLAMSVFLDRDLLERLQDAKPFKQLKADQLNDLWTVLEGISHFNYIAWRARKNRNVSLLELELQAEIDKFVSTLLIAVAQDDCEFSSKLHGWLFDDVSFSPELDRNQQERYSTANDYAARFCHRLMDRWSRDQREVLKELRQFYRLSQREKISHINASAFSA